MICRDIFGGQRLELLDELAAAAVCGESGLAAIALLMSVCIHCVIGRLGFWP